MALRRIQRRTIAAIKPPRPRRVSPIKRRTRHKVRVIHRRNVDLRLGGSSISQRQIRIRLRRNSFTVRSLGINNGFRRRRCGSGSLQLRRIRLSDVLQRRGVNIEEVTRQGGAVRQQHYLQSVEPYRAITPATQLLPAARRVNRIDLVGIVDGILVGVGRCVVPAQVQPDEPACLTRQRRAELYLHTCRIDVPGADSEPRSRNRRLQIDAVPIRLADSHLQTLCALMRRVGDILVARTGRIVGAPDKSVLEIG